MSEAVRILAGLKQNGHIDPDLFDLLLRSGVYRTYAQRFLDAEQVDEIDLAAYLA